MVLASLAHELAHWVFVKAHGFQPAQPGSPGLAVSDTSSLHSVSRASVNSVFLGPGNPGDVATQAVHLLFGVDFELLTLTMGDRCPPCPRAHAADTVTAVLTPAGTNAFHGCCLTRSASAQFDIRLTDELVDAYKY